MIKYIMIGFLAQLIDGAMGMAYGVSCRTGLKVFVGIDSIAASAVVHCSEVVTSLVSGISHYKLKNYDKGLLSKLLLTGIIGGILGALTLTAYGNQLEIFVNIYLVIMGIRIFFKAFQNNNKKRDIKALPLLGLIGGFLDAIGGGGWGPVVTSSLIARGEDVKKTIGSVNIAEFFVTIAETTAFAVFFKDFKSYTIIILGLILGGVIAAPIAALFCKKVPTKFLLSTIGILLIALNAYELKKMLY